MTDLGFLRKQGVHYEFHYPEHNLVVRGHYIEWVLEAAAEIITQVEKMRAEGHVDELKALAEFGEADGVELDAAVYDVNSRFDVVPQCIVSMGSMDYRWVSPTGRHDEPPISEQVMQRLHDMSRTRGDTFLKNVDGVDTTASA